MKKIIYFVFVLAFSNTAFGQPLAPVKFRKQLIASESFESVGVFDINADKIPDVISGSYWYEGPAYLKRHYVRDEKRYGEYYDDFSTIPMDVNGDGRIDYVTGGWFGKTLNWYENPGNNDIWKEHIVAETGNLETTRSWDVDGDGFEEIVPNTPNNPLVYYTLTRDANKKATGEFAKTQVIEKNGHGLGFGDINGDGRGDFIVTNGWVEAPADRKTGTWILHPDFKLGPASIPIIVTDVNKDGFNDFIVGQAHGYGLDWYEQKRDNKKISWIKHAIDPYQAQFHTMAWEDIDNDGQQELVTGKRYRAHNGNDPGDNDPPGLYYYKWNGESFSKQVISYGEIGEGKGTGIYFVITDLRGNGRKDIVVAGKDGLYIFYNEGR